MLVYCDLLTNASFLTGEGGVAKVILNNVSAHIDPNDHARYDQVARQLMTVMAAGGEIDVQWDRRDEKGRKDSHGKVIENDNRGMFEATCSFRRCDDKAQELRRVSPIP